jgi:hypothetical protein
MSTTATENAPIRFATSEVAASRALRSAREP